MCLANIIRLYHVEGIHLYLFLQFTLFTCQLFWFAVLRYANNSNLSFLFTCLGSFLNLGPFKIQQIQWRPLNWNLLKQHSLEPKVTTLKTEH